MILKKYLDYIVDRIVQSIELSTPPREEFVYNSSLLTMDATKLEPRENDLLKKYGKDKDLLMIFDKWFLASTVLTAQAKSEKELDRAQGFLKAIEYIKSQLTQVEPKQKFDPVTGQPIPKQD